MRPLTLTLTIRLKVSLSLVIAITGCATPVPDGPLPYEVWNLRDLDGQFHQSSASGRTANNAFYIFNVDVRWYKDLAPSPRAAAYAFLVRSHSAPRECSSGFSVKEIIGYEGSAARRIKVVCE